MISAIDRTRISNGTVSIMATVVGGIIVRIISLAIAMVNGITILITIQSSSRFHFLLARLSCGTRALTK